MFHLLKYVLSFLVNEPIKLPVQIDINFVIFSFFRLLRILSFCLRVLPNLFIFIMMLTTILFWRCLFFILIILQYGLLITEFWLVSYRMFFIYPNHFYVFIYLFLVSIQSILGKILLFSFLNIQNYI